MRPLAIFIALCTATPVVAADLLVVFQDSSPKDRLIIYNEGCEVGPAVVTLDLTSAAQGVFFDTISGGQGQGVSHEPEVVEGNATFAPVADGDQILNISMNGLQPLGSVTITFDVDDTDSSRQIVVNGSEFEGSSVTIQIGENAQTASIGADGRTNVIFEDTICVSS
jgi:hypothetical protein